MVESRGMYPMFRTTTPGILAWTSVPCDYCVFSTCCHTQLYPTSKILLPWLVSLDAHRFHEIKGCPADCFTFTVLKAVHDVMTWKHSRHYWSFVRWINQSLVDLPHEGPVMQSFDIFFIVSMTKLLNKQSRCQWFETPLCTTVMQNDGSAVRWWCFHVKLSWPQLDHHWS